MIFKASRARTVAVIGGGFSGTIIASNLLRSATSPTRVILIESRMLAGRGLAYSTGDSGHLLNVPASKMGAYADDLGGFQAWAATTLGIDDAGAFLPRKDYGRYLESVLANAARNAVAGVDFLRVRDAAARAEFLAPDALIRLNSDAPIRADHVVLALGSGPPRIPAPITGIAHDTERVIPTPFAPNALNAVGRRDRVLVLGTGLTMYDAAITLGRTGFAGEMACVSRRGRIALPHQAHSDPSWASAWAASVASIESVRSIVRSVRDAVARAADEGADWRGVIDALRPHLPAIWASWSPADRQRFLAHVGPYWEVCRHRCAPEIWSALSVLSERGGLSVIGGRIESAEIRDGRVTARIRPRGEASVRAERFDRVLVCAGPETDISRWNSSLVRGLLSDGWLTPDAIRLGVLTDRHGSPIGRNTRPVEWLSVVGPLRKATLWESTAVPELRNQARDVAQYILSRMSTQPGVNAVSVPEEPANLKET